MRYPNQKQFNPARPAGEQVIFCDGCWRVKYRTILDITTIPRGQQRKYICRKSGCPLKGVAQIKRPAQGEPYYWDQHCTG